MRYWPGGNRNSQAGVEHCWSLTRIVVPGGEARTCKIGTRGVSRDRVTKNTTSNNNAAAIPTIQRLREACLGGIVSLTVGGGLPCCLTPAFEATVPCVRVSSWMGIQPVPSLAYGRGCSSVASLTEATGLDPRRWAEPDPAALLPVSERIALSAACSVAGCPSCCRCNANWSVRNARSNLPVKTYSLALRHISSTASVPVAATVSIIRTIASTNSGRTGYSFDS